jgi:hypothetical protein
MFKVEYRQVVDISLPLPVRVQAFYHCVEWYCWLSRQRFQQTYLRLGAECGFDFLNPPDGAGLLRAAAILQAERRGFLKKVEAFAEARRTEKAKGQRQPRKAQLVFLYSPDWLRTSCVVK